VLVTTSFPISNDGSEAAGSFVSDLAEELARHFSVRVVAPGISSVREQWSADVEVFRYATLGRPLSTLKPWHPAEMVEIMRVMREGMRATRDAVSAGGAAHILALWALPSGEWARRVGREHGIAYSVWMLGSDVWSLGRVPIVRGMLARVMREAMYSYADGYQLVDDARRIANVPVSFLPSTRRVGLSDPPLPHAQPPYRLLFLGRWHPNKGVDLLLEALALLSEEDWRRVESIEIHGGGPLESLVRERVASLNKAGRPVELGGYLSKQQAEEAIARADWVLIPSRIESIPVVFSDAMKLGRPVIASPVGDLPRLLMSEACGVLVEGVSAATLCRGIRRALMESPRSFGPAVRDQAAHFDLSSVAGSIRRTVLGDD
jgi:glycosyltransferase involved in cell wall biosynthesis